MRRRDFIGSVVGIGGVAAYEVGTPRLVRFSGYDWRIKASDSRIGPGPNRFSRDAVSLFEGQSLRLSIREDNGNWPCAEIISRDSFGYGTYRYYVRDAADLDLNAVLGLFTWDSEAERQAYRELDIEVGRWGSPINSNCQFVLQPATREDHIARLEVPPGPVLYEFAWRPTDVAFRAVAGYETHPQAKTIGSSVFRHGVPAPGNGNARMNLWLMAGRPPKCGKPVDIVIDRFEFVPDA